MRSSLNERYVYRQLVERCCGTSGIQIYRCLQIISADKVAVYHAYTHTHTHTHTHAHTVNRRVTKYLRRLYVELPAGF